MKKTIIGLVVIIGLLLVGCGNQPKSKVTTNWDPSRDVLPKHNGKLHGLVKNYDGRGNLLRTTTYVNGVRNGADTYYSRKNRKLDTVTMYKDGKKNGVQTKYRYGFNRDPNALSSTNKIDFIDGKRNGFERHWEANGRLVYEAPYKNDELNGVEKLWFKKDGKLSRTITYRNGKKHGPQKDYSEGDGSLFSTEIWSNGEYIKRTYSTAVEKSMERSRREDREYDKKLAAQKKKSASNAKTSSHSGATSKGRTRITRNDGKFIAGVCSDESTFFIEVNGPLFQGSGTNGVCTKADLGSTISCVCSGG